MIRICMCCHTHTHTCTISFSLCETHWKQISWRQQFTHFYSIFHLHEYAAPEKKGIWCWKRSRKEKILPKKFAFSTTSACTCKHVRDCGWAAEDYKAYKALVKTAYWLNMAFCFLWANQRHKSACLFQWPLLRMRSWCHCCWRSFLTSTCQITPGMNCGDVVLRKLRTLPAPMKRTNAAKAKHRFR